MRPHLRLRRGMRYMTALPDGPEATTFDARASEHSRNDQSASQLASVPM